MSRASTDSLEESFMNRSRRETSSTCSDFFMNSLESAADNDVFSPAGNVTRPRQVDRPVSQHVPGCMQQDTLWQKQFKHRSESATSTFACRPTHIPGWEAVTGEAKKREAEEAEAEEEEELAVAPGPGCSNLREEMVACGHPVTLYREEVYLTSEACRGFLDKMGGHFKTWHRRWFVFDREQEELRYYLNTNENRLKGAIPFSSMSDVYVNANPPRHYRSPNRRLTFCLGTPARTFYFVAESSEVMRIWIEVLLTAVLKRNTMRPA